MLGFAVALRLRHGGLHQIWFNGYANEFPDYIPSDELLNCLSYTEVIDVDSPLIAGSSVTVYRQCGNSFAKQVRAL